MPSPWFAVGKKHLIRVVEFFFLSSLSLDQAAAVSTPVDLRLPVPVVRTKGRLKSSVNLESVTPGRAGPVCVTRPCSDGGLRTLREGRRPGSPGPVPPHVADQGH